MNLLGVDVGTTGVRALVINADGTALASATQRTSLRRPGPGLVVTDFEEILRNVTDVVTRVVTGMPKHEPIAAISFSLQGEAFLPVDNNLQALALGPVSMDQRGISAVPIIADRIGVDAFQSLTGQPLHPMFPLLKLAADKQLRETVGAEKYLCLGEFLAGRIGAKPLTDTTMAARMGGYAIDRGEWDPGLWELADVGIERLPDVVSPGTVIGEISRQFAESTGLRAGTAVIVGSHDQAASFWGGGGSNGKSSVFAFGSSDCLTVGSAERPVDLIGTGFATYRGADDSWLTLAGTAAGGWALEWLADLVAAKSPDPMREIFEDLGTEPSNLLVLPYLSGSGTLDNDPHARGAILGLTLTTSRNEIVRAFVESAGYELAKIVEAMESRGLRVGDIRGVGTGAWNTEALGLRANASGRPLTPVQEYASARGAAIQAGVGVGAFSNFSEVPQPKLGAASQPSNETYATYQEMREQYSSLFEKTQKIGHILAERDEE